MTMIRPFLLPISLAAVLLAGCAGAREPAPHSDPAQTIQVAPGADFQIALTSNQSTGYQWILVDSAALGPLRSAGSRYEVPRRNRDRGGAGGTETWTFQALRTGEGTIALVYKRPWEPPAPADTTRFHVVVR